MSLYNIAFDTNNKTECLNHFSIKKKKGFIFKSVNRCEIRPIGSILLDFLNIDIENGEDMVNFIANYCLEDLLFKLAKKSKLNISKYYKNDNFYITEQALSDLFFTLQSEYEDDFEFYQDIFINLITSEKENISPKEFDKIEADFRAEFPDLFEDESANFDLINLSYRINDLTLDFTMDDFYYFHKELNLPKSIPYSFRTDDYLNVLFISYKQLLSLDSNIKIKKCANCGKYFIPKTMHDTKYCDEVFKDNKTCKEFGRELAYKESLAQKPILKAYRSRYQTLSKQASEREKHEMYEYFKKEGPTIRKKFIDGEITAKEFQDWINSTKVRKK